MDLKNISTEVYRSAYCTLQPDHNTVGITTLTDQIKTAMLANHPTWFAEYQAADVAADVADALVRSTLATKTRLNAEKVTAAAAIIANQATVDASDAVDTAYTNAVAAAVITTAARTC